MMPSRLGGFETRFRCLSPAPAASSASSFVAPPDLAALRRIRGRVGDRRAYTSSLERESLRGQRGHSAPQGSGFGLATLPDPTSRRVPPSRTRSISRDRSVERLSADSPEVVSRFEFCGRAQQRDFENPSRELYQRFDHHAFSSQNYLNSIPLQTRVKRNRN